MNNLIVNNGKTILASGIGLKATGQFSNLNNIDFNVFISVVINFLLITSSILFFFMLLTGGLRVILSQGKKENLDAAYKHITNAFIGLIIVFSSWAIISFIESALGINIMFFRIRI
jgi:Type IV secretion system pilin